MWLSVFILDLSVVISMMLFMESIGGKPSHKSRALHPDCFTRGGLGCMFAHFCFCWDAFLL